MRKYPASRRLASLFVLLGASLFASGCGSSDDAGPVVDEDTGELIFYVSSADTGKLVEQLWRRRPPLRNTESSVESR